jgi:hypothetical protein
LKEEEDKIGQVCCERCKRWSHTACTKYKDEKIFICDGCKEGDYFRKSMHLPEMVQKLGEYEMSGKLDGDALLLLDSIILHLSSELISVCLKPENVALIDRFYMKKSLNRISKEDSNVTGKSRQFSEYIFEITHFLAFRKLVKGRYIAKDQYSKILKVFLEKDGYGVSPESKANILHAFENKLSLPRDSLTNSQNAAPVKKE